MADEIYGVQPTGYVRRPIAVILADIESRMVSVFGPGVIQTSQSPFGQLNGLFADLVAEIDERNLDIYQSFDADQAEGNRLDIIGRVRPVERNGDDDAAFRQRITNKGSTNIQLTDFENELSTIDDVTFSRIYVTDEGLISAVVLGGDETEIANVIYRYVAPGVLTTGNVSANTSLPSVERCQSIAFVRPTEMFFHVKVTVRRFSRDTDCPKPAIASIRNQIVTAWPSFRINGDTPNAFNIRQITECNIEGVEITSSLWGQTSTTLNNPVVNFDQIVQLTAENVQVVDV